MSSPTPEAAPLRLLAPTLLALALLAAPTALAHPEGEDPYYAKADVHPPRAPGSYQTDDDCAYEDKGASSPRGSLRHMQDQITPSPGPRDPADPAAPGEPNGSVAHLVPECYVVDSGPLDAPEACVDGACIIGVSPTLGSVRASYNLTSGDYALLLLQAPGMSGNSGMSLMFDCAGCPPPGL